MFRAVVGLFAGKVRCRVYRLRASLPPAGPRERRWARLSRLDRQTLITEQGMRMRAVLDESVLRCTIGGRDVLRGQLRRLLEVVELPNVSLQVLPFDAGACVLNSFTIIDFPDAADPSVIFIESQTGALYLEQPNEVRDYTLKYDYLRAAARNPAQSTQLIADLAKE